MKQRLNECLLASVCATHGADYETASDLFRTMHGRPWYVSQEQFDQRHAKFLCYVSGGTDYWTLAMTPIYGPGDSPDLSGHGILVIRKDDMRHAVAYADGLIYDPNLDDVRPFAEWLATFYSGWYIDTVTRTT